MKQNKVCPKCNNKKILKIKDVLHSTGEEISPDLDIYLLKEVVLKLHIIYVQIVVMLRNI